VGTDLFVVVQIGGYEDATSLEAPVKRRVDGGAAAFSTAAKQPKGCVGEKYHADNQG